MIIPMLLATAGRCASPTYCPTAEQLLAAVRSRDASVVQAASDQFSSENPGEIVMVHPQRIKRISDILCGDRLPTDLPGNPPMIHCKFTVRYWSMDSFEVARMVLRNGEWKIDDALSVARPQR